MDAHGPHACGVDADAGDQGWALGGGSVKPRRISFRAAEEASLDEPEGDALGDDEIRQLRDEDRAAREDAAQDREERELWER